MTRSLSPCQRKSDQQCEKPADADARIPEFISSQHTAVLHDRQHTWGVLLMLIFLMRSLSSQNFSLRAFRSAPSSPCTAVGSSLGYCAI